MNKRILVWTAQMAKHRLAKELGVFFLDSTAMTGRKEFAPEMRNVRLYKDGELSEEEYTRLYVEKMRMSVRTNAQAWDDLANHDRLIVACYCRAGKFCHRHIWLRLVTKYFKARGITVIDMGEFTCAEDLQKAFIAVPPVEKVVKYPHSLSEANTLTLVEKVDTFLVASYAYYILHETLLPDTVFDFVCECLQWSWDKLDDASKQLIDKESLSAGTFFQMKKEDYPDWVKEVATKQCTN